MERGDGVSDWIPIVVSSTGAAIVAGPTRSGLAMRRLR